MKSLLLTVAFIFGQVSAHKWPMWGQDVWNCRRQDEEIILNPDYICDVRVDWSFEAVGDVITTVTESGGSVYFVDERAHLYSLREQTGRLEWSIGPIGSLLGRNGYRGAMSHSAPLITENFVIIGTAGTHNVQQNPQPDGRAVLAAFWRTNGTVAWSVELDSNPTARIDQSAIEYNGYVFVGTSSMESHLTNPDDAFFNPDFDCCSFGGQFFKIEVGTGEIVETVSLSQSGTGAGAFGNTAAIDGGLGLVFVSTQSGWGDRPATGGSSVHAFNVNTFEPVWSTSPLEDGDWFAQGPVLAMVPGDNPEDPDVSTVFVASVGGRAVALNAIDGSVIWTTELGAGGMFGGSFWGSSTDGYSRFFVAITHGDDETQGGFWYSLSATDGRVLWETQVPVGRDGGRGDPAYAWGAVSYAAGVVYCPAMDTDGTLFALSADSGRELVRWQTGGTLVSGASISNSRIFVGSGFNTGLFSRFFRGYNTTRGRNVHALVWKSNP